MVNTFVTGDQTESLTTNLTIKFDNVFFIMIAFEGKKKPYTV